MDVTSIDKYQYSFNQHFVTIASDYELPCL